MNLLIGTIPALIAFAAFYGYYKSSGVRIKRLCFRIPMLMLLSFVTIVVMIKWYEVPIHHNRISYVVSTAGTPYTTFEGTTAIEIRYNYNTYKGIKELGYGYPKGEDSDPGIIIETCAVGVRDTSVSQVHSFGGWKTSYYKENETIVKDFYRCVQEGRDLVSNDSASLKLLGVDFNRTGFVGSQLIVDVSSSNRQFFYPVTIVLARNRKFIHNDSSVVSMHSKSASTLCSRDSIFVGKSSEYFVSYGQKKNSSHNAAYTYIPPTDSVIYQSVSLSRTAFSDPNVFFTAEDISRAVEILWIDGRKNSNRTKIKLKSLTFDYIGPADFSNMSPEPDVKDVSKIVFNDPQKLDEILEKGLRFHVKFPDMENVQQMRMFGITLVVGGLLGLLFGALYTLFIELYKKGYLKFRLSDKTITTIYIIAFVVLLVLVLLCTYRSYVDAFDLDENNSWGIFNIIGDF